MGGSSSTPAQPITNDCNFDQAVTDELNKYLITMTKNDVSF